MRTKLTPAIVADPPVPKQGRSFLWEGNGFGLMVTANGAKSFVVQYRAADGRTRRVTLRRGLTLTEARREARAVLGAVAKGADPVGDKRKAAVAARETLRAICEEFLKREGPRMRTANQWKGDLERLVYPVLGQRHVNEVRRSDIVRLLDDIEDERGPHMAEKTLKYLSRVFNWHAARSDDFRSPMVRMGRTVEGSARERTLTDDELRAIWHAAETFDGPYGALVRFALLTATRRSEASRMVRSELTGNDWIIPAARMKAKREHVVPLSAAARGILDGAPRIGPWVFTLNGRRPLTNFVGYKAAFDKACGVTDWRFHDIRRTSRSLMSRAGVAPDIAERCLAHVIGGIRGVYDRHAYHDEKARAFEALAGLIGRIVDPVDNVVELMPSGTK